MSDRAEVISLCVRLAAAAALSFLTVRYMVKFLDPNYASREENKKKVAQLFRELGINGKVELNEHELRIATQFVGGEDAGAEWSDIGGCDELIAEMKDRIILPLQIAAEADSPLLSPPKGILLYGPPGCGKTLIAKAVARAAGCRFINLQVSNLTDKWYGESQKLAAAVFSVAQKFQPTIIFIDEIDSFLRDRQAHDHEATAMMKAQFMSLWDGFASTNDQICLFWLQSLAASFGNFSNESPSSVPIYPPSGSDDEDLVETPVNDAVTNHGLEIIVMGATNRPQDVDLAILRRMSARFAIPLPSEHQREQILKVILRSENLSADVDLKKIASMSQGLAGSDLKEVCRLAVLSRAKATLADQGNLRNRQPIQSSDLEFALLKYARATQHLTEQGLD